MEVSKTKLTIKRANPLVRLMPLAIYTCAYKHTFTDRSYSSGNRGQGRFYSCPVCYFLLYTQFPEKKQMSLMYHSSFLPAQPTPYWAKTTAQNYTHSMCFARLL